MRETIFIALFLMQFWFVNPVEAETYGKFVGRVAAEWQGDGRKMKLLEKFQYIGPDNTTWEAPAGAQIDGASIPQFAWSIIGGPFEGKYRAASVIHDIACEEKSRPWQSVHEAFYTAMLASGVDPSQAKIMYAAVYHFGPRWSRSVTFELSNYSGPNDQISAESVAWAKGMKETRPDETLGAIIIEWAQRLEWGPPEGFGSPPRKSDRDLNKDYAVVEIVPKQTQASQSKFKSIEKDIRKKDLSLEQIRSYFPQR